MTTPEGRIGRVLRSVVEALDPVAVPWAITGSTALALRGLDLEPADVDLQTTAGGAYAIESALPGRIDRPVRFVASHRIRSHFGTMAVDGVAVEIMGAVRTRRPDGTWTAPTSVRANRRLLKALGVTVPVMRLEHEVGAYERLGRLDRAATIRELTGSTGSGRDG
ncbi:MAG: nucleotidyltransferase domain-containing protein [Halobacteriales archaeon]